jgi:hypothetical protein
MRVGALLQEIFRVALAVDWQSQPIRRAFSPLPPLAVSLTNLPLPERLRVKQIDENAAGELELSVWEADPAEMDEEFLASVSCLGSSGTL